MDKRMKKPILTIIITVVIVTSFVLAAPLQNTFALIVEGENYGLKVALSEDPAVTENLNPGDVKQSTMTISNEGSYSLPVYLSWEILEQTLGEEEVSLADQLWLKIERDQEEPTSYYDLPINQLEERIYLETLKSGESVNLNFSASLEGAALENLYQGTSLTVQWKVQTEYVPPDDEEPDDDDDKDDDDSTSGSNRPDRSNNGSTEDPVTDSEAVPPQETVAPDSTEPDQVEAQQVDETLPEVNPPEEIPFGVTIPKTGEQSPILFYAMGCFLIGLGVLIQTYKKLH